MDAMSGEKQGAANREPQLTYDELKAARDATVVLKEAQLHIQPADVGRALEGQTEEVRAVIREELFRHYSALAEMVKNGELG